MADWSFTLRLRLADDGLHDKVNLHKHDDKADHDDECGGRQRTVLRFSDCQSSVVQNLKDKQSSHTTSLRYGIEPATNGTNIFNSLHEKNLLNKQRNIWCKLKWQENQEVDS